ncbi:MAG: succinyl-diaminopimelate desuccinylase [Actinomycetota bacterium]|nr:succinyl-diaminopimelate desuccinylase [Actinomycetota bacterium]
MTLLDTLIEIVDIPSVTGDEAALCSWLEERFSGTADVVRIGDSVVVGTPRAGRPFYALYGHTDTVPVQGEPSSKIVGDRIQGLGVSDMKSGVAVMIELLNDDAVAGSDVDVVCVFYDKEEGPAAENGLEAVLEACPWLLGASLSIVMEPTDLNLELGCNGVLNAEIVFSGSSAHAARPWLGENAVTKAGSWLAAVHDREPEVFDIGGLLYREVFSVTKAHGGIATNIIPPSFTITLNHRFPPIFSLEEAEARLREVAAAADEITITDRAPAGRIELESEEVLRLDAIIGRDRVAKQGWTDVARLTSRGAIAVNYGPGEVAQAHQVDESMPIANLAVAFDVMRRFITRSL